MSAAAPSTLGPDELVALGYWLRAAGMHVHPGQIIAASRLLRDAHRLPPVAGLAPWLAPVFCTNALEQDRFGKLYEGWLRSSGILPSSGEEPEGQADDTTVAPPPPPPPPRRWWWIGLLCLPAVLLAAWMAWTESQQQPAPAPVKPSASAAAPAERDISLGVMTRVDRIPAPKIRRLPGDRGDALLPMNAALRIAGCVILLAAVGWWVYAAARRRGFLERLPVDDIATRRRLATSATPALAAYASALRYLGREMRRRRATASRRLDVHATLEATAASGGLPSPVFGNSLGEPVYLVLVERVSAADHQAALGDEVVRLFHAQGVAVERYVFDGDPRFARHVPLEGTSPHAGVHTLDALLARHPDSRLIIFSDGNGLIDRYTGAPAAWISGLLEWPMPVLVTPQPVRLWALREWALARAGMTILPLEADGLRRLGQFLHEQSSWEGIGGGARRRTRPAYLRDVDQLLDRRPLDRDMLDDVLLDLELDLGNDAMEWLAACAVYPDIRWAITLAVGDSLARDTGRDDWYAQRLALLSRLPWMRMGFMPDWLRTALLRRLSPASEEAVRRTLDRFLAEVKAATQQQASTLEIALEPRLRAWNDFLAGLRAWMRLAPKDDRREDAIFLHFMNGPRKALTVDAGKALMRLLYRGGLPLRGPQPWIPMAALALAACAFAVPPVDWLAAPVPPRELAPKPAIIALSGDGGRIAVSSDVGGLTVRTVPGRAGEAGVDQCPSFVMPVKPDALAVDSAVVHAQATQEGSQSFRVDATCRESPWGRTPVVKTLARAAGGGLSFGSQTPASQGPEGALCTAMEDDGLLFAARKVVEEALPAEARPAVTCAFAQDRTSLLVAARSGRLFEFPLTGTPAAGAARGTLPSAVGTGQSIATDRLGGDIAAVTSDGRVWLKQGGQAWSQEGATNARAPVTISAQGNTLAFADANREVTVWRALPPQAPPADAGTVTGPVAPSPRKNDKPGSKTARRPIGDSTQVVTPGITVSSIPNAPKVTFDAILPVLSEVDFLKQADNSAVLAEFVSKLNAVEVMEVVIMAADSASIRQAETVKTYLTSMGVDPARISIATKRIDRPFATGRGLELRASSGIVKLHAVGLSRQQAPAPASGQQTRPDAGSSEARLDPVAATLQNYVFVNAAVVPERLRKLQDVMRGLGIESDVGIFDFVHGGQYADARKQAAEFLQLMPASNLETGQDDDSAILRRFLWVDDTIDATRRRRLQGAMGVAGVANDVALATFLTAEPYRRQRRSVVDLLQLR